jgi:predicted DNA-binding transcriptional regulator
MILPTKKQLKVLAFIKSQKTFPTFPQISTHFGWASDNAARAHVAALLKKGKLKRGLSGKYSVN